MFYSIRKCPIPVIGRINGAALGGGSGLVASTDFSLALSSAKVSNFQLIFNSNLFF